MRKIACLSVFGILVGLFFIQAVSSEKAGEYRGFVVRSKLYIPDRRCTLVELEHTESGAQVMHVQNDDPENFFAICFRTLPTKSNGVAHILEHSVLQGSEKFPINNVFFHMNKRSLATFMNASTGQDYTFYPAASQCPDDFYNLLTMYSDAVFHPLLTRNAFLQEGHRIEFETFDDPTTPLVYKGVVYNEMKGYLASHSTRMYRAVMAATFPDAAGDVLAGGDPKNIPELTHEEFVQFHKDHYYPGNSLFFFYGNLPLEGHLDFLADHVLKNAEKKPPVPDRPLQPVFTEPRYVEVAYPDDKQETTLVGINWLINDAESDVLGLRVLDNILMASDASLLKHDLLGSGICTVGESELDVQKQQFAYMLYFEGCDAGKIKELEAQILATLNRIVNEGIASDTVERTIARIELDESDLRKGNRPVGSTLFATCVVPKMHGRRACTGLTSTEQLKALRATLKDNPRYFADLISKCLINNPHRVCVALVPSKDLAKQEAEEERQKLQAIKDGLSQEGIAAIISQAVELKMAQNPPSGEAVGCLPSISLESVSKEVPLFEMNQDSIGSVAVFHHPIFTNHITYASLEFPLPQVTEDELWQVGLYAYLLPQLGSCSRGYLETLNMIQEHTGGIATDIVIRNTPSGSYPALRITGRALDRKAELLCNLIYDAVTSADFADSQRIRQLLIKHGAEVEAAIKQTPIDLVNMASLSSQSVDNHLVNSWGGLAYCINVQNLVQSLDGSFEPLIAKLQDLQKRMLPQNQAHLVLACDEDAYKTLHTAKFGKLCKLPHQQTSGWNASCFAPPEAIPSAYTIAAPIAFNARSFCTVSYTHPDSPYLLLAAGIVSTEFLHTRVREQGGAYGVVARYEPHTGNFSFVTYRDPNIASSDEAFHEAIAFLAAGNFTEEHVQKAKLGLLQRIDAPLQPYEKAFLGYQFLCEVRSDADRKLFRHKILTALASDIQRASKEHLSSCFSKSVLFSFASKDLVAQENKKLAIPLAQI